MRRSRSPSANSYVSPPARGRHPQRAARSRPLARPQNQLKKPHAISFSKSNAIRPFEDSSSLAFWASKNDASLFLVGSHTKKRPHGLVWARCFAGEVMEMLEVGIEEVMAMSNFKVRAGLAARTRELRQDRKSVV